MKHSHKLVRMAFVIGLLAFAAALWISGPLAAAEHATVPKSIAVAASEDGALFTAFVPVLRHPRCMNCHSQGDFPRQGDDGHPHAMNVRRGPHGHGVTAEKCSTCNDFAVSGIAFSKVFNKVTDADANLDALLLEGRSPLVAGNYQFTPTGLSKFKASDKLVMWAWDPGEGRLPVPLSHDEFSAKVKQWADSGAPCPK